MDSPKEVVEFILSNELQKDSEKEEIL